MEAFRTQLPNKAEESLLIYNLPNSEYIEKLTEEWQLALGVLNVIKIPITIEKWSKITGIEKSELLILAKTFQIPTISYNDRPECFPRVNFDNQKIQESHKAISVEVSSSLKDLKGWRNQRNRD